MAGRIWRPAGPVKWPPDLAAEGSPDHRQGPTGNLPSAAVAGPARRAIDVSRDAEPPNAHDPLCSEGS